MNALVRIHGGLPRTADLAEAVYVAAEALGLSECYAHDGSFHFSLGGGWSIALSSDSAHRIRIDTCRLTRPTDTVWILARKHDRLAKLVVKLASRVTEPV